VVTKKQVAVDGYTKVFNLVGLGGEGIVDGKKTECFDSFAAEKYNYCFRDVYSEANIQLRY